MKEYVPIIKYIKETDNDATYDLSRLSLIGYSVIDSDIIRGSLVDINCVNKLDGVMLKITQQMIYKRQHK